MKFYNSGRSDAGGFASRHARSFRTTGSTWVSVRLPRSWPFLSTRHEVPNRILGL